MENQAEYTYGVLIETNAGVKSTGPDQTSLYNVLIYSKQFP